MKILLLLLIFTLSLISVRAEDRTEVNYYSPENIKNFADYLYEQEDYIRAGWEYDRLRIVNAKTSLSDSAVYKAGLAYMKGGDFVSAERRFGVLINNLNTPSLKMDSRYYYARVNYFLGEYLKVTGFLEEQDYHQGKQPDLDSLLGLLTITYTRMQLWDKAHEISCGNLYGKLSDRNKILCSLVVQGRELPQKSKFKACLLSTVLPGSGKLYAGRKADALYAFIIIGLTGWQAYEGFDRDGSESVQGWIYGVLAGGLYLGNIYGASVAVDIFNRKQNERYFDNFEKRLGLDTP